MMNGQPDMQMKTLAILTCASLALAGCGRGIGSGGVGSASSGLNPFKWFGSGSSQQATLTPDGGYPSARADARLPVAHIASARWEPLYEGRMLIVEGLPNTKGWWNAALITELPMPEGRIHGDEFGVLRLRLVGMPPPENTYAAAAPAQNPADRITTGITLPHEALATIREVVITGATNSVTLRR